MKLKFNDKKLTPVDVQMLNMAALVGSGWRVSTNGIDAGELGDMFVRRLFYMLPWWGVQFVNHGMHQNFRLLSWRGQRLMYQWLQDQLASPIDVDYAKREREREADFLNRAYSGPAGPSVANPMTATQVALQQQQAQQQLHIYQQQMMQAMQRPSLYGSTGPNKLGALGGQTSPPPAVMPFTELTKFLTSTD